LAFDRPHVSLALGVAMLAALTLSACGRAGPLELPPGPAAASPAASAAAANASGGAATKTGFDRNGNPVAAPGEKKAFFLDPLLR
jgi:predicted small lipoprotein YifL